MPRGPKCKCGAETSIFAVSKDERRALPADVSLKFTVECGGEIIGEVLFGWEAVSVSREERDLIFAEAIERTVLPHGSGRRWIAHFRGEKTVVTWA